MIRYPGIADKFQETNAWWSSVLRNYVVCDSANFACTYLYLWFDCFPHTDICIAQPSRSTERLICSIECAIIALLHHPFVTIAYIVIILMGTVDGLRAMSHPVPGSPCNSSGSSAWSAFECCTLFHNNENTDIADMNPMNQIGRYNDVLVYMG